MTYYALFVFVTFFYTRICNYNTRVLSRSHYHNLNRIQLLQISETKRICFRWELK